VRRRTKAVLGTGLGGVVLLGGSIGPAAAETVTHRVNEDLIKDGYPAERSADDANWYREDTRPGSSSTLGTSYGSTPIGAPPDFGNGSLILTTNNTNSAKAQLITSADVYGTPLADVDGLDYWTYQATVARESGNGNPPTADASYQLRVDLDGDLSTTGDVANLVFEPYWNDEATDPGSPSNPDQALTPDTWQHWDATGGNWWSSKTYSCTGLELTNGGGGAPFYTPAQVAAGCPGSKVVAIGANVGSFNPNYIVATDGIHISTLTDDFTTNFEPGPK
jgi:hypothetical protein